MSVFTAVLEPPPLPGHTPAAVPVRFAAGMKGNHLLGIIFRVCRELRVSDIQMRADRPVYIHTNKGMEKLEQLGILSPANMDEILKEHKPRRKGRIKTQQSEARLVARLKGMHADDDPRHSSSWRTARGGWWRASRAGQATRATRPPWAWG